ncbi:MAG TPA: hydantoinase B/oxoprolinase family protein [Terriglobales bacterium]|nr:hydantoinase B/oxoprolinase family protein [Terriglobales bacterium]
MRDPVELEVFKNLYHSIAEEMGATLRRTSFSPNIKERRDYSCAVFDGAGKVIAMGDHMPVHLGSMPMSVAAAVEQGPLDPGDVVMLNDPFRGGTHLPDITMVMPVYVGRARSGRPAHTKAPHFYVASRAHHADVGGTYPGSMGPCREIYQEGLRIPPVKIMRGGKIVADVLALLLSNVRTAEEREGDLGAQIAACQTGAGRLREICVRYGLPRAQRAADHLIAYSEKMMRAFLHTIPPGRYQAEDFLDDDGVESKPVRIVVTITVPRSRSDHVTVDFSGSDPQVQGAINAVEAITYSACFYVFRCLLQDDVPATTGLMRPIRVIAPPGTVVNARPPAAVAGGNVETSQRIVDVLLRSLAQAIPERIPAAASGTMNNLTIGGIDFRLADTGLAHTGLADHGLKDLRSGEPFAYYETIAGGMGARPTKNGVSGVHTHMTNSLNTPAEALEYAYPVRLRQYSLRPGSGGEGLHSGGDGIVREIEVSTHAQVTLLADRRSRGPYGLAGGSDGSAGRTTIIRNDGSEEILPGQTSVRLNSGERVRIESPGGGGWGKPISRTVPPDQSR